MRVYVAGPGLRGGGYPNAARTVELLKAHLQVEAVESVSWLPDSLRLWELTRAPPHRAALVLASIVFGAARSLVRILAWNRTRPAPVYVPYPSVFFMSLVSLLPTRFRPACIVDSYISVWDSMFRDRGIGSKVGVMSRLVKWAEGRALRAASCVLVDTEANQNRIIQDFGLERSRVRSLPLAIEETPFDDVAFLSAPSQPRRPRVLFVGTLIPLHGVSTVLSAIGALLPEQKYDFRIVGDGQLGHLVSEFLAEHGDGAVAWVRGWQDLKALSAEIAAADVCLGVFGGDQKAARVLPFKLYMYLASGRAVISQHLLSTPSGVPSPPIRTVPPEDPEALAAAIRSLAESSTERFELAAKGRDYYRAHLANQQVARRWATILSETVEQT